MPSEANSVLLTLQSIYVRRLGEHVEAVGGNLGQWLEKCGFGLESLGQEVISVPPQAFIALVIDAIAITKEPALGLLVGEGLKINTHGLLGFAAINGRTLHQVMELLVRYLTLRTNLITLCIEEVGDEVRLVMRETMPLGDARMPVLEAIMLALKNMLDYGSGSRRAVRRVSFACSKLCYDTMTTQILRCDVSWGGSWTGLAILAEHAHTELRVADTAAFEQAAKLCERELERLAKNSTMSAKVKRLLLNATSDLPSLTLIARQLHLTPRTVHRRLIAEDTNFSQIVESIRHNLALEHLRSYSMGIQEVALVLGYSDEANFRRAFRRWEGVSPSAWRAQQAASEKSP